MRNTSETIREITREHLLKNNGLCFGQCLTAVGWVAGTVPELREEDGIVELPTSDVSNSGIVVGAALMGKRPIYIIRYQGFVWYNAATLVNYAAKSKYLWGVPCPVFVRALAMEGGIGPVASNAHHSMILRMPGIKVVSPMTPGEYLQAWEDFMINDDPVFCSEHRLSFNISEEDLPIVTNSNVTLLGISAGRINARKVAVASGYNYFPILWLKPLDISEEVVKCLKRSKIGIVVDSDFSLCGASQYVAYELMHKTGRPVYALGLEDCTAGFSAHTDNTTPSVEKIVEEIRKRT